MKIQLSDHFTYQRLLHFCLPSIVMMIFTSIYGVVDGLFVSNFVGNICGYQSGYALYHDPGRLWFHDRYWRQRPDR